MKMYELKAVYDSRKSFYGKAIVVEDGNSKTLFSYCTPIVRLSWWRDGTVVRNCLSPEDEMTMTTRRHYKEFMKQELGGGHVDV